MTFQETLPMSNLRFSAIAHCLVVWLFLGAIATAETATAETAATETATAKTYGNGVTLEERTPIAAIIDDPDAWQGKRVAVEGKVNDVCPKKGCWMSLRDADGQAIRVKVEDDVIVFPEAAKEHHAVAEGTVKVLDLDLERYTSWMAHLAEERGETFDPESVGEGPYRIVQIEGEGAEIDL